VQAANKPLVALVLDSYARAIQQFQVCQVNLTDS